jgi:signal transduction histidine kinase
MDAIGISVINKGLILTLDRESEQIHREITLLASGLRDRFTQLSYSGIPLDDDICGDLLKTYAQFYGNRDIDLYLNKNGLQIFPSYGSDLTKYQYKNFSIITLDGNQHIYTSVSLPDPYSSFELYYLKNIGSIYSSHNSLVIFFVLMSIIGVIALVFLLTLIIKKITRPISMLSAASKLISSGGTATNITRCGSGEIVELIDNFNWMSESIKRQMDELTEIANEKERISDSLAHEIRTPLTSIHGFAEYIRNSNGTDEDKLVACEYILSETDRLTRLVNKILDISRIRSLNVRQEIVNVVSLFVHCEKEVSVRNIDCVITKEIANETIHGDFDLLFSFIMNCIDNSTHAKSSKIKLLSYISSEKAVIEILDDGYGMNSEFVKRESEPFERADRSRSREHGGAGLGLTLCKMIADAHGAEISIDSNFGIGTSVKFLQPHNNNCTTP